MAWARAHERISSLFWLTTTSPHSPTPPPTTTPPGNNTLPTLCASLQSYAQLAEHISTIFFPFFLLLICPFTRAFSSQWLHAARCLPSAQPNGSSMSDIRRTTWSHRKSRTLVSRSAMSWNGSTNTWATFSPRRECMAQSIPSFGLEVGADAINSNVMEVFKTPGKLRGKTPRTARKQKAAEPRKVCFQGFPKSQPLC